MSLALAASIAAKANALSTGARPAAGVPGGSSEIDVDHVLDVAGSATVGVRSGGCGRSVAGSGFIVGGRVLTNAHVVDGAGIMDVAVSGGSSSGPARPLPVASAGSVAAGTDADVVADLASSWILAPGDRAGTGSGLALAPGDAVTGQTVVIVARVGGELRWMVARVQLIADDPAYGGAPVLVLDRAVGPGWSGGPVLDSEARVVGVTRAVDHATGLTLAVPVTQLQSWLVKLTDVAVDSSC